MAKVQLFKNPIIAKIGDFLQALSIYCWRDYCWIPMDVRNSSMQPICSLRRKESEGGLFSVWHRGSLGGGVLSISNIQRPMGGSKGAGPSFHSRFVCVQREESERNGHRAFPRQLPHAPRTHTIQGIFFVRSLLGIRPLSRNEQRCRREHKVKVTKHLVSRESFWGAVAVSCVSRSIRPLLRPSRLVKGHDRASLQ